MNTLLHPLRWFLASAVVFGSVVACGGNFVPGDGEDGGTGSDSGTDSGSGGNDGTGAEPNDGGWSTGGSDTGGAPGASGGTGGQPECCLAFPACNGTDKQIDSEADCPVGATCYSSTICCSTIWCMEEQPACDAIPVCLIGETQVSECPEDGTCVARALCGTTIICQDEETSCDRDAELDRHYVADSPESCATIDFACPEFTNGFSEDCGCGCEQPAECPDYVDCAPGAEPDALCSSEECPYTVRAN